MEKKKSNEELQSRREFFKKAAKRALPILGAIVLASAPGIVKAAETTPMNCDYNCYNSCSGSCSGGCDGSCQWGCGGTCKGTCDSGCRTSCTNGCRWSSIVR